MQDDGDCSGSGNVDVMSDESEQQGIAGQLHHTHTSYNDREQ